MNNQSERYSAVFKGERDLASEEAHILLTEYDNEIRFMDSQISRLFAELKSLGLYDSTLIVVTSDHGESFGEHRLLDHGRALYEELIRVPLIIKYPLNDKKREVIERPVTTLSLMPTILDYAGCPVPKTVDSSTLNDRDQVMIAEIFRDMTWTTYYGERFNRNRKALYDGQYKWIWDSKGAHELYDSKMDPAETNNLWPEKLEMEQRFQSRLLPLIEEGKHLSPLSLPEIDQNLKNRLRALGYIQ